MTDTLQWQIQGVSFEDGSTLAGDWRKIHESGEWHWQYDTHELAFQIYEHDGQYWKLYRVRFVPEGASEYAYGFGGQACRMALVRYRRRTKSPHSSRLMDERERRSGSAPTRLMRRSTRFLKAGRADPKYGAPYGRKQAA